MVIFWQLNLFGLVSFASKEGTKWLKFYLHQIEPAGPYKQVSLQVIKGSPLF